MFDAQQTLQRDDAHDRANASDAPVSQYRVAYLTNAYPKISHSFIRNEILALERNNFSVERLTIRQSPDDFIEGPDKAEFAKTTAILNGDVLGMLTSAARTLVKKPKAFMDGLKAVASTHKHSAQGFIRCTAYFLEACRLSEWMERKNIRHVHVHFGTNPATVARIASKLGPLTYSMTMHGPDEFDAPEKLQLREKVADAAFSVAISSFGRSQIMRWSSHKDWSKIAVVRCGTDPMFLQQIDPAAQTGLEGNTFVCVARLSPQKGIVLLIEAAGLVAQKHKFKLRIIGDGPLRAEIEDKIAELGLQDTVTLCGWMDQNDVWKELTAARTMVLPSFAEGLPVVIMEALALGCPVIATAINGIPELVDQKTGWLVPAGSVTSIADAMVEALHTSPDELRQMGETGRARVKQNHDIDQNARALGALLKPLV